MFAAIAAAAGLAVGVLAVWLVFRFRARGLRSSATQIREEAEKEAGRVKETARVEAESEVIRLRETFETERRESAAELREEKKGLLKREDTLERKMALVEKKEQQFEKIEQHAAEAKEQAGKQLAEAEELVEEQKQVLQRVSGLSAERAKQMLLERIERELDNEVQALVQRKIERAGEQAEEKAREIVTESIQRLATDVVSEVTAAALDLPSDELKGRIIGREGRNIRAFERATGVELIVDDTPGVVVVSTFDSVRREIARRTLERLVKDGRIHPARIEEVTKRTEAEVMKDIDEAGRQTALEMEVALHPKIGTLLGRLKYRTSYGQNALLHSKEVARICEMLAAELKLDTVLARRCGLLHDLGKALDQESEGTHPELGAEVAARYDEKPEVVDSARHHHETSGAKHLYTVLVQIADAISAGRPGARRESLELYIKRLEKLEALANAFPGVEKAFAIQAGREVRVIASPDSLSEAECQRTAREIAKKIEEELSYPGEVRITLIREARFIEYAR